MHHRRFILVCRSRDSGDLEIVEEHVTNLVGLIEGSGETGVHFAVLGNESIWSRPMVEEQYEIIERLPADEFFSRLGHRRSEAPEGG